MSDVNQASERVRQNGDGQPDSREANAHVDEGQIPHDLPRPGNWTVVIAVVVFVLLLAGLFVIGFVPHQQRLAEVRADARDAAADALVVSTIRARVAKTTSQVVLPGNVQPFKEASIFARATGYLKSRPVDIGDHVNAGQLLAEIDTPEIDAQLAESKAALEQSKASVAKAEADADLAKRTLERFEDLVKRDTGGVSEQQLDQTRAQSQQAASAVAEAKANVVAAEAAVQRLSVLQGFEKVIAPFAGTITARSFDPGAYVSAGSGRELFRLVQSDPMLVYVNVPQTYSTNVRAGDLARLHVRNYTDREFTGTVTRTSGALDPATRTLNVELQFPNPDAALLAGMYGQVSLCVDPQQQQKPSLIVPSSALVYNADGLRIATVQDGNKVKFQPVTLGRDLGTELEVTGGLADGDVIVANPGEQLAEGSEVKAVPLDKEKPAQPQQASDNSGHRAVAQRDAGSQ